MELWIKDLSEMSQDGYNKVFTKEFNKIIKSNQPIEKIKRRSSGGAPEQEETTNISVSDAPTKEQLDFLQNHFQENSIRFKRARFLEQAISISRMVIARTMLGKYLENGWVKKDKIDQLENLISTFVQKASADSELKLKQGVKRLVDPQKVLDQAMESMYQELRSIFNPKLGTRYIEKYNLKDLLTEDGITYLKEMIPRFKADTLEGALEPRDLQSQNKSLLMVGNIFEAKVRLDLYKTGSTRIIKGF
jgi:hypothetical protein